MLVSTHPAILPAPLYYRQVDDSGVEKQSYETMMTVSEEMRKDLSWWLSSPQWQVDADHAVGQNDRVRCINARMGSKLQLHQHGWVVVSRQEPAAYQLSGDFFGTKNLCHNFAEPGDFTES